MRKLRLVLTAMALAIGVAGSNAVAKGAGASKSAGGSKSKKSDGGNYRSAKSGQYVQKGYADRHKSTTVREDRAKQ